MASVRANSPKFFWLSLRPFKRLALCCQRLKTTGQVCCWKLKPLGILIYVHWGLVCRDGLKLYKCPITNYIKKQNSLITSKGKRTRYRARPGPITRPQCTEVWFYRLVWLYGLFILAVRKIRSLIMYEMKMKAFKPVTGNCFHLFRWPWHSEVSKGN